MGTCRDELGLVHIQPRLCLHPPHHSRVRTSLWWGPVRPPERDSTSCRCCSSLRKHHPRLLRHWLANSDSCLVPQWETPGRNASQPWWSRRDLGSSSSCLPLRG